MIVCCIMRAAISDEFSCKFVDALPKEILQMLNKSFGTLEDLSSIGHRSFEREKIGMVQWYRARTFKFNRTN